MTPRAQKRELTDGTPRWVKVFAIVASILALAFVVLHITGHSPANHMSSPGTKEHGPRQP
jgi:hypothetical protein